MLVFSSSWYLICLATKALTTCCCHIQVVHSFVVNVVDPIPEDYYPFMMSNCSQWYFSETQMIRLPSGIFILDFSPDHLLQNWFLFRAHVSNTVFINYLQVKQKSETYTFKPVLFTIFLDFLVFQVEREEIRKTISQVDITFMFSSYIAR